MTCLGLNHMRKAATEAPAVPIALLTEDPQRHTLLQNGAEVKHAARIVFSDVRFNTKRTTPHHFFQLMINPRPKVVVVDLTSENARVTKQAIALIRALRPDIAVFVRFDPRNLLSINSSMLKLADAYLQRDGTNDVQLAFDGFRRGGTPPGATGPPWLPPPPPVPVHSFWDISRDHSVRALQVAPTLDSSDRCLNSRGTDSDRRDTTALSKIPSRGVPLLLFEPSFRSPVKVNRPRNPSFRRRKLPGPARKILRLGSSNYQREKVRISLHNKWGFAQRDPRIHKNPNRRGGCRLTRKPRLIVVSRTVSRNCRMGPHWVSFGA